MSRARNDFSANYLKHLEIFENPRNYWDTVKQLYAHSACFSLLSRSTTSVSKATFLTPLAYKLARYLFVLLSTNSTVNIGLALSDLGHRHFPRNLLQYLDGNLSHLQINRVGAAVEEELIRCGKSAFISTQQDIIVYMGYLQRNYGKSGTFTGAKTRLSLNYLAWTFETGRQHRVVRQFVRLQEMGIYNKLVQIEYRNKFKKDSKLVEALTEAVFKKSSESDLSGRLQLGGSIATIFIILGCGGTLGSFIFGVEACWSLSIKGFFKNNRVIPYSQSN